MTNVDTLPIKTKKVLVNTDLVALRSLSDWFQSALALKTIHNLDSKLGKSH